jgi:hypothetical protein
LDILTVLILSLPEASQTLVEGVITRPERVVVGSSTIASAITGSAPRAELSADYRVFYLLLLSEEFRSPKSLAFLGDGVSLV